MVQKKRKENITGVKKQQQIQKKFKKKLKIAQKNDRTIEVRKIK